MAELEISRGIQYAIIVFYTEILKSKFYLSFFLIHKI